MKNTTHFTFALASILVCPVTYSYPEMNRQDGDKDVSAKHFGDDSEYVVGEVREVIQVKSYTYLRITDRTSGEDLWLATSRKELESGQLIRFVPVEPLRDFHSTTLKRSFPTIQFVSAIEVARKRG